MFTTTHSVKASSQEKIKKIIMVFLVLQHSESNEF